MGKPQIVQEIKTILPLADYGVLAVNNNGMEALRLIHRSQPDLIIMSWTINGLNPADFLQTLTMQRLCPVIVVLSEDEHQKFSEVIQSDAEVVFYPVRAIDMLAVIAAAEYRFNRANEYRQQVQRLEEELKTRKLIYQAVLRLIQQLKFDEETAYASLRRQAMYMRKSIRAIALEVIQGIWLPGSDGETD